MKKLVMESLDEFMAMNEEGVKKVRRQKATAKQPAKTTAVMDQSKIEKAEQAIKALEATIAKEKKSKGDKAKIADAEKKIEAYKKKIADEKAKK